MLNWTNRTYISEPENAKTQFFLGALYKYYNFVSAIDVKTNTIFVSFPRPTYVCVTCIKNSALFVKNVDFTVSEEREQRRKTVANLLKRQQGNFGNQELILL